MKELLSYAVGIAGLVVTAIAVFQVFGKPKYGALRNVIVHNLRTSSQRAQVMCNSNPMTCLEPLGAAIKAGALAYSEDATALAAATRPAFDAAAKPVAAHWEKIWKGARTGMMLGGGALILAIMVDVTSAVQVLIAIPCVLGGLYVMFHKLDVERSLVLSRVELLPEVDQMFVERRYQYAAPAA